MNFQRHDNSFRFELNLKIDYLPNSNANDRMEMIAQERNVQFTGKTSVYLSSRDLKISRENLLIRLKCLNVRIGKM